MDWTVVIVAILGSSVVNTLIVKLMDRHDKRSAKKDNLNAGVRLLLLDQLKRSGKEHVADGSVTKSEYDAYMAAYDTYKALGGDGWADKIKGQIECLPVVID